MSAVNDEVVAQVTVDVPCEQAFDLFLDRLGEWWPRDRYSLLPGQDADIEVDRRLEGLVSEVSQDGKQATWGALLTWEPPQRFAMSWLITPGLEQTIVSVDFQPLPSGATQVRLTHSGWDQVGPTSARAQEGYAESWPEILQCFADSLQKPRR